jgi:cation:H+ antiporter
VLIDIVTVVGGLVLLTIAADRLVLAAARLARISGLSPILIGAVVVGLGTSLPEMLVSGLAAARPGGIDLALGNIVGSNIANLALVLGLSVVMSPIIRPMVVLKREGALMLAGTVLLVAFAWDGSLLLLEGVILGVGLIGALVTMVKWSRNGEVSVAAEVDEMISDDGIKPAREVIFGLGSLGVTLLGAQLLVTGAQSIAIDLGISEAVIGMTLVAVGTSLPELATAVAAARRKENELVLGNVLGSNLFNSLGVGAVTGVVGNGSLDAEFALPMLVMIGVILLAGILANAGRDRLSRTEGFVLLATYPLALLVI